MQPILRVPLVVSLLLSVAAAQRLIAVDSNRTVYTIDRSTAAKVPLGVLAAAVGTPNGLAAHAPTGTVYISSSSTDSLYTFDPVTGATALVGPFGDAAIVMQGLELIGGQLYGTSSHNGGLYSIDRSTGVATLVGPLGIVGTPNLVYDSRADRLFATSTGGDSLYSLDRTTGGATLIGNLQGSSNPQGVAFDADTGTLWMVDNASDLLYAIDSQTGQGHAIGSTGAGNLLGLAYLPGGSGSIQRFAHHCGNATITGAGDPGLGGTVSVFLGATTGVPFIGFGVVPTAVPFCGCTIGHEWSLAFAGSASNVAIPMGAGLLGFQVAMQGLDLFGSGGCADPALGLTDTLLLTIG